MFFLEECQRRRLANRTTHVVDANEPLAQEWAQLESRRQFLRRGGNVLGAAALSMLGGEAWAQGSGSGRPALLPGKNQSQPGWPATCSR